MAHAFEPPPRPESPGKCPFGASEQLVALARERCPAFSGGCPFAGANTREDVPRLLGRMPPSHADPKGCVAIAVEEETRSRAASDAELTDVVEEWVGWWAFHADDPAPAPAPAPGPPPAGLAARLKKGTEAAHAEAENVSFVKLLLKGQAPLEAYVALVAALRRIYGALERAADRAASTCPVVASVCVGRQAQLRRAAALDADLAYYRRRDAALTARAEAFAARSRATNAYVAALDAWPGAGARAEALVAHLYTRYLGDLSGGQILRRAVARAYALAPPGGTTLDASEGVAFYDFPLIGASTQLRRFKDTYREALDALDVTDPSLVVAEAVDAFRRNTALLKELDFVVLGATEAAARHARPQTPKKPGTCPFLAKEGLGDVEGECPVTGQRASTSRKEAPAPGCPVPSVGPRDVAIVGGFFLLFLYLIRLAAPPPA